MKLLGRCYDQYETYYCFIELTEEFFKFLSWVREGIAAVDPEADESAKRPFSYDAAFNRVEFTDYHPTFIEAVPDELLDYITALDDEEWVLVDDAVPEPEEGLVRIEASNLVITECGIGWTFQLKHSEGGEIGTAWLYDEGLEKLRARARGSEDSCSDA
jgi:hypothetical protein